ncbi:MAG TPA: phage holin family protein [Egibacteraceae bacterium]
MRWLIRLLLNGVALWIAAAIVPGITLGGGDTGETVLTALLAGIVFGVVNAVIKPVVTVLALPLYVLTLGLLTFVVNALLLWFTAWLAGRLGLAFTVDGFVAALLGAIVVSLVSIGLNALVRD